MTDPIIYTLDLPVSSLTVSISGETDPSTSGFIYSPTGGVFTSGIGVTGWAYDFVLLSEEETFSITAYDTLGDFSNEVTLDIPYEMTPPVILTPGKAKIISDNISSSGSTSTKFQTLSGNFVNDGIIVGDILLGISGKNINLQNPIKLVADTYLETESFSNDWETGDEVKVYSNKERPTFTSNKLKDVSFSGICSNEAQKVIYSDCEVEYVTIYNNSSSISFEITSLNDTLNLIINGIEKTIILSSGTLSISDIVFIINSYYSPEEVAYEDSENGKFYLKSRYIKILDGSANTTLGFEVGEYLLGLKINTPDTFKFTSAIDNVFNITVDGKTIDFTFELNTEYSKQDLIDKINTTAEKKICFYLPTGIIILSLFGIKINKDVFTGVFPTTLYKSTIGTANYTIGNVDWNFLFDIIKSQDTIKVFSLDIFYRFTSEAELNLNYKIDPPTLATSNLTVSQNFIDLSGAYDIVGVGVKIKSTDAFSTGGNWVYTLQSLSDGENIVTATTSDIFGNSSDPYEFIVTYNNPENVGGVPSGSLHWEHKQNPSLTQEQIDAILKTINYYIDTFINYLTIVNAVLDTIKAFISSVLSPLDALRSALQSFIDKVSDLINQVINCEGLYILEVWPTKEYLQNNDFFSFCQGGFDNFINKIVSSFDDEYDSSRPQFNENSYLGGLVIAVDSGDGVDKFLDTLSSLKNLIKRELLDIGLKSPENIQAVGENKRAVITWQSPKGLLPSVYEIFRSEVGGGELDYKLVKSNTNKQGEKYTEEIDLDTNGNPKLKYTYIGKMIDPQVLPNFKFIDGKSTSDEKKNQDFFQKWLLNPTVDSLTTASEFVMVNSEATGTDLTNGKSYYYKIVPRFVFTGEKTIGQKYQITDLSQSAELTATPSLPELVKVFEDLSNQVSTEEMSYIDQDGKKQKSSGNIVFQTSRSIYDKNTGTYASDPYKDVVVTVDGSKTKVKTITSQKGIIYLNNAPKLTMTVEYWAKKEILATRAVLEGTNKGPFIIKNDPSYNSLEIQVGEGATILKSVGGSGISISQKVTFIGKWSTSGSSFNPFESKTLEADEVVSLILSQTHGLNAYVSPRNTIVLEEDLNPDIYASSYLKILKGNKALGFVDNPAEEKFTSDSLNWGTTGGGISNYQSKAGPISGTPPDWYSIRTGDLFPILNDMLRYVDNALKSFLSSVESATKSLIDFIELLQTKVSSLSDMAEEVKKLIKDATEILYIKGGIYCLQIPNKKGGNKYFIDSLTLTTTGKPLKSDYTAGIVLLYSSKRTEQAVKFLFPFLDKE